ncbi:growth regulation protein [[Candida] railenensis]|uniref:Growth regulation protein n=1 Tax=[Candida] railenensis TaxID=45579 RepID=A0A9P0QRV2_9ASCO|nr:growth regulation protein [[Candida] railenensis]
MADIITQVTQESPSYNRSYERQNQVDYDSKIHLNVRNNNFTITREELMSLPESILLCLFPNGVFLDASGQAITNLTEDDTVFVNFEPSCFEYIIDNFGRARKDLLEMPQLSPQQSYGSSTQQETAASVLQHKPAIIVLREDLDYYIIPPMEGFDADNFRHCKINVASYLLENKQIFSGLGYNTKLDPKIPQHLGPAEQHLLDMLCSSGFEVDGEWGSRSLEPGKCVVSSLSLVRLQSAAQRKQKELENETPPMSPQLAPVQSNASVSSTNRKSRSRIATLASSASRAASRSLSKSRSQNPDSSHTKLLLFWRKPARKCWWSNETIEIDVSGMVVKGEALHNITVKVHIRRVWTLELSVIGVQ